MTRVRLPRREGLDRLIAVLGGGDSARPIGGVVRDTLLGVPVSDIDLATRLRPEAVLAALEQAAIKAVPTGLAHGTVTAVLPSGPVEVTTLRRDVATDGRHATVAFTDDWRADAARRDFTMNALSADPETGTVFDYFGGVEDARAGRVRFIGDPLTRIAEDHLRILRFFRFHARFGAGAPDPAGLAACAERANDLMALSRERIAHELLKLLSAEAPLATIEAMLAAGIFRPVVPEIADARPLARLIEREAAAGMPADPLRRLAALIGPDPARATSIAARLKLSNAQAKRLAAACAWSERGGFEADVYRLGRTSAIDRLLLGDGDPATVTTLAAWQPPVLPIGGGALIDRGLAPGPVVARTLAAIEREWVASGFPEGPAFDAIVARALLAAR